LVLLEASESNLYQLKRDWKRAANVTAMIPLLGNVADEALVERIFAAHAPKLVFHAAAFKHVPLMEEHPLAAMRNNIFATETLVRVAAANGARVVLLSTDKAVAPTSVMGATKRVAEQMVLAAGGVVLRLGNVLASRDSVAEIFAAQIAQNGPITVTDPAARRYFLTHDEAVNLLMTVAAQPVPSALLAPALPATHFVSDLAHFLAETLAPERDILVDFTGMRAGDKDTEVLWEAADRTHPSGREFGADSLLYVETASLTAEQLGTGLANLRAAVEAWDLSAALNHLRWLVPDYRPSAAVEALAAESVLPVSL
jgi:FlaA1/EpsC-like NDP-sugar epimerase